MANEKITVEVIAELQKAIAAINNLSKIIEKNFSEIDKTVKQTSNAFETFQGVLASEAVIKGLGFLKNVAEDLFKVFIVDGVKAAQEQENAVNDLNNALARSGNFTKEASRDFQEFANELQRTTTFSDDVILSNAALLASMSKLDAEGLKRATKAALDLSVAYKIDLETATRLVGKAAEGNVESFKRFGIEVKKGSDDATTYANALNAIEKSTRGAAEAQTKTFAGALEIAKNNFNDLQEEIGGTIVGSKAFVAIINELNKFLFTLIDSVKQNKDVLRSFAVDGLSLVVNSISFILKAIAQLYEGFVILKGGVRLFVNDFIYSFESAVLAFTKFQKLINVGGIFDNAIKDQTLFAETVQKSATKDSEATKIAIGNAQLKADAIRAFADQFTAFNTQIEEASKQTGEVQIEVNNKTKESFDELFNKIQEMRIAEQDADAKKIEALVQRNELLKATEDQRFAQEIADNQTQIDKLLAQNTSGSNALLKQQGDARKRQNELDKKANEANLKERDKFLSDAATLSQAKSKELAAIGKAAAITQIAINTPESVSNAFNFGTKLGGPPLGFTFAAIAAAAQAAQAARVAGVPLATGGQIPGGFPNDSFQARLTSGERVLNVQENRDFTQFISGNNETNSLLGGILNRLERLENTIVVNIGGREIIREVQRGLDSGRILEVG